MVFVVAIHPTKILPTNYSSHASPSSFARSLTFVHWSTLTSVLRTAIISIAMSLFRYFKKEKAVHSYQILMDL